MKALLSQLNEVTGTYMGEGINHEGQAFTGRLKLKSLLGGRGFQLMFSATGKDGTLYHKEESTIAPSIEENLTLWNFNTNTPGLVPHELRRSEAKPGAMASLVFGFGNQADRSAFREEIALDIWDKGNLSYTYSWGLPGGDFQERSGVRMTTGETIANRPDFIKHYSEIQEGPESSYYRGTKEFLSIGSPFAKKFGLTRLGIHHELLPAGRRTSWPHAESAEEEFVYVIEGNPDGWINGEIHRLNPGDAVGFPSGTGISHTFINNTDSDVRLLVVGETSKKENKIYYPLNPSRREPCKDSWWHDVPKHDHGPHDGLPDRLRGSETLGPLNYTGEVIVESLHDKSVLDVLEPFKIKGRRADMPSEQVKVWNINRYCLDEQTLGEMVPRLEKAIDSGGWYVHFYSDLGHKLYVVFKGKHFVVSKKRDSSWDEMIRFGESIGVERRWTEIIPVSFKV